MPARGAGKAPRQGMNRERRKTNRGENKQEGVQGAIGPKGD